MCLFGLFRRKKKKRSAVNRKNPNVNSFGERMDRLTKKGDLPFGWSYANRSFTGRIENEYKHFFDAYCRSRRKGILQEYAALKSLIIYIEDVNKLCSRKGVCYQYWASKIIASSKELSEYKTRLKQIEKKMK